MATSNKNIITCIVTALVIVVFVHYIFKDSRCMRYLRGYGEPKSRGKARTYSTDTSIPIDESFEDNVSTKVNPSSSAGSEYSAYNQKVISDQWRSLNVEEVTSDNPIPRNEEASMNYVTKQLIGGENILDYNSGCPKPAKSREQFQKDFFAFRDMTQTNSSIREDAVDKIQQLYLDGNLSRSRSNPNMRIKDIFDNATSGPKEYTRQCVRLPQFDDVNLPGYQMSYGQPAMQLTGSSWSYPNEKIINGGAIKPGLFGADPYTNYNLEVSMMDQNIEQNYGHKYPPK